MTHIKRSSGAGYVLQLLRLSVKSVASYALVFWSHVLDVGHKKLHLWIGMVEQTVVIRAA